MKPQKDGVCHVCGTATALTFEHVPPRSAFNDKPVLYREIEGLLNGSERSSRKGFVVQKGMGAYTLCSECNNRTGAWYGRSFVEWAYQGMCYLQSGAGNRKLCLLFHIYPLRVLKQIVCMFCTCNGATWATDEMRAFVLQKEKRYIPDGWRVHVYYSPSRQLRNTGIIARINTNNSKIDCFSEITFPPFGYVMTRDPDQPPDDRLVDITFFSEYSYRDWRTVSLNLLSLPVHSSFPGDYRTRTQVQDDIAENIRKFDTENCTCHGTENADKQGGRFLE